LIIQPSKENGLYAAMLHAQAFAGHIANLAFYGSLCSVLQTSAQDFFLSFPATDQATTCGALL
jgi:hypothetical protein